MVERKLYSWKSDFVDQAHEQAEKQGVNLRVYLDMLVQKDARTESGKTVKEELNDLWDEFSSLSRKVDELKRRVESFVPTMEWDN
jgi:hypothetical protein